MVYGVQPKVPVSDEKRLKSDREKIENLEKRKRNKRKEIPARVDAVTLDRVQGNAKRGLNRPSSPTPTSLFLAYLPTTRLAFQQDSKSSARLPLLTPGVVSSPLPIRIPSLAKPPQLPGFMASNTGKKLIQIDVSSDTVCPWCFVGKKNLEKAMEQSKDKFDFEVRWHPFFLNPNAPKEGIKKSDYYRMKFGPIQFEHATARMTEIFRGLGMEYDMSGLTGNTMDSHRLINLAGHQGYDKQSALVEELFQSYFCQGKFIGDRQVLLDAARKVGIERAEELLQDSNKGVDEVKEELNKYSSGISGVPHFVINGKYQLSGGQPPNTFIRAFEVAAKDGAQ